MVECSEPVSRHSLELWIYQLDYPWRFITPQAGADGGPANTSPVRRRPRLRTFIADVRPAFKVALTLCDKSGLNVELRRCDGHGSRSETGYVGERRVVMGDDLWRAYRLITGRGVCV